VNRAGELVRIEKMRKGATQGKNVEQEMREIAETLNMDPDQVASLVAVSRELISLDMPMYADDKESQSMGDFIRDDRFDAPDEAAVRSVLHNDIESALATLDGKEAEVIRCRFGLEDNFPMSLREIGNHFDLTKERIRQIEKKALTRLSRHSRGRLLASYVA
jgi:RNA polymerase primary sigma factor